MDILQTLLIVWQVLFSMQGNYAAHDCWRALTSLINANFTTNTIWRTSTKHVGLCGQKCSSDKNCLSFGYNFVDYTCQGHNKKDLRKGGSGFQISHGAKYFIVNGCKGDYTYVEKLDLCYKIRRHSVTYHAASDICQTDNAGLLRVDSNSTIKYFADIFNTQEWDEGDGLIGTAVWGVWIDGKYNNGLWVDKSGKQLQNISWDRNAPKEPFSATCLSFSYTSDGHWIFNRNCKQTYYHICEIPM